MQLRAKKGRHFGSRNFKVEYTQIRVQECPKPSLLNRL